MRFCGTVKAGRVHPDDSGSLRAQLEAWEGKRVSVEVQKETRRRTTAQNARYWLIVRSVAELFSSGRDLPIHPSQAHEILKKVFNGEIDTPLGPVGKSTKKLSTAEFSDYCDRIEAHFASIGHPLPITEAA